MKVEQAVTGAVQSKHQTYFFGAMGWWLALYFFGLIR
jgi:hypothetical protein